MKLILMRHGESIWNVENRFTGWTDIPLTNKGITDAKQIGRNLKDLNVKIDKVYTSSLQRATKTAEYILTELNQKNLTIKKSWRLNERHYGALQGLSKDSISTEHKNKLMVWRRSWGVKPPNLKSNKNNEPLTESLEDTFNRVIPYFKEFIMQDILAGSNVLVVSHSNTLRTIIKYLDNISDYDIEDVYVDTCKPIIYDFNKRGELNEKNYSY